MREEVEWNSDSTFVIFYLYIRCKHIYNIDDVKPYFLAKIVYVIKWNWCKLTGGLLDKPREASEPSWSIFWLFLKYSSKYCNLTYNIEQIDKSNKNKLNGFQWKELKLYSVSGCDLNDTMPLHRVYLIQLVS